MWRQAALALVVVGAVGYAASQSNLREIFVEKPLPILGVLPDFTFIDQDGDPVTTQTIDGEPAVFSFFFTSCQGPCPMLNAAIQKVITDLGPQNTAKFISISIDPENDDPAALKSYAQKMSAPDSWFFVTGAKDAIYKFAEEGLKLGVDGGQLTHSTSVALVDAAQAIRGYYRVGEAEERKRLMEDIDRITE